jgi:putative heme-binding domain-containing protein
VRKHRKLISLTLVCAGFTVLSLAYFGILGRIGRKVVHLWQKPTRDTVAATAPVLTTSPIRATSVDGIKVKEGFRVELLYAVPKERQGTWVCLCVDPKGRLIASDQNGGLYRVTPPALQGRSDNTKIETLPVDLGEAQGLVWAFDSLYVVVNHSQRYESGLWKVYSSKNDDSLDARRKLRGFEDLGYHHEHGPHAVLLSPDGKSLYVVCGNSTRFTDVTSSAVPPFWAEDSLLPRMEDPKGFAMGCKAPAGCIYQMDPEGKEWKLIAMGLRNTYDAAFNRDGELFTADNDMDWDFNLPWYRPTRVVHAVPGSDFGWRSGSAKKYESYPDNLPPVMNLGPGGPSGVSFGYGARFPAKYQNALFVCDWALGKLYAVHLTPRGSSYQGDVEEFMSGTPLPLSDLVVNPSDGAVYLTIGGRGTTSALYRLTYVGGEPTEPAPADNPGAELRALRHRLESFYGRIDPDAVEAAWPHLGSDDRFIRWAARTALEFQPAVSWQGRASAETDPNKLIPALLGLVRVGDKALEPQILAALDRVDWAQLDHPLKIDFLRSYQVLFARMGPPAASHEPALRRRFNGWFPADSTEVNVELCRLLSYLDDPQVVTKSLALLARAPSPQEQIEYAASLRVVRSGWSIQQCQDYFNWFHQAAAFGGGQSFHGYLARIRADALGALTDRERTDLKGVLDRGISLTPLKVSARSRPFVKNWTVGELLPIVREGLKGRNFERGHRLFAEALCFACHRYRSEGGALGPDLTNIEGRLGFRDLLESIIEPSKVIADQYAAQLIATTDGKIIQGKTVGVDGDKLWVITDLLAPDRVTVISRERIESITLSKVSMMPTGLLDTLTEEEVLDLVAFLYSQGNPKHPVFVQGKEP